MGDGAFMPNHALRPSDLTDGLSHTLAAAEVKAYQPNIWDTGLPNAVGATVPALPGDLQPYFGGTFDENGHTEWVDGAVHETGFTTAWPPNKQIIRTSPASPPLDLVNWRESAVLANGGPSLGAITSRSYHPGGVNTLFGDGSVRFIKDSIDGSAWRSLGTISGGEVISSDAF